MNIMIDENGVADVYDDTYDIVIHCESEKDQNDARLALKNVRRWIPVTERLPEVSCNSMLGWDKNYRRSCLVQYNGYGFILPTGQYMDIIAWMPLPEPYTEDAE